MITSPLHFFLSSASYGLPWHNKDGSQIMSASLISLSEQADLFLLAQLVWVNHSGICCVNSSKIGKQTCPTEPDQNLRDLKFTVWALLAFSHTANK